MRVTSRSMSVQDPPDPWSLHIGETDILLPTPRRMSLEQAIGYRAEDELLAGTHQPVRLRKSIRNTDDRGTHSKRANEGILEE